MKGSNSYGNFASKGEYGYPEAINEEYSSWNLRCKMFIEKIFGLNSPVSDYYNRHESILCIGNDRDAFNLSHKYIMGALRTSIDTLTDNAILLEESVNDQPGKLSSNVFVVHGHDEGLKKDTEIFLSEIGLNPIVLHRQADEGQTIIENLKSIQMWVTL